MPRRPMPLWPFRMGVSPSAAPAYRRLDVPANLQSAMLSPLTTSRSTSMPDRPIPTTIVALSPTPCARLFS